MISIAFFHNTSSNIFSKIIQLVENSPISHSAIKMDINGVSWLLHSAWGGVAFIPMAEIMGNHTLVAEFQVLVDISNEVELAKKKIGQPYDVLTLFGYLFVFLGRTLNIGIDNPFYSKAGSICSEFIIEADVNHIISEFDGLEPANISPKDLFNICNSGKDFRRIS